MLLAVRKDSVATEIAFSGVFRVSLASFLRESSSIDKKEIKSITG